MMAEQFGNPLFAMLAALRRGEFLQDAIEELGEVLEAVEQHRKKGQLTITFTFTPSGVQGAVTVGDTVTGKLPRPEVGETLMFFTGDGGLSRRDPRQPELPFTLPDEPGKQAKEGIA